jgi:SAM-dependent methyltransferase
MHQNYDQLAEAYRRNREPHPLVLGHLRNLISATGASRALEIGCGTGNYISAIAASTAATCTGVEPSHEMLRIARSNPRLPKDRRTSNHAEVIFLTGVAENLPLSDQSHDLVFSVDVIHHVQNRVRTAEELFRVLKPDGVAVVVTESEADLRNRTPQITYFPETLDVDLNRYPSLDAIETELNDAGFELMKRTSVSMQQEVSDSSPFRDKAFSSLHLIPDGAFERGLALMQNDLRRGSITGVRRYTIVAAQRP